MVVQDAMVLREELDLIAILSSLSEKEINTAGPLLNRIKTLINEGLCSSRPSISLDIHQRLVWCMESDKDLFSGQLMEHMCTSWFMCVFRNAFTEFSTISESLENVFNGHVHESISNVSYLCLILGYFWRTVNFLLCGHKPTYSQDHVRRNSLYK
jgi:hypothetical protein